MTAFGISPLGTDLGPFGGPGLITVLGVLPYAQNSFVVVFDREPRSLDDEAPFSGINIENYALTSVDCSVTAENGDTVVPPGCVVPTRSPALAQARIDSVDPTQVIITTDSLLEPGVLYRVDVTGQIKSADGDVFAGPTSFTFKGRQTPRTPQPIEVFEQKYRDLDYVLLPDPDDPSTPTQVYRQDDTGDIALAGNDASLRKRLIRRITTQPGGFAFAPEYGVGLQVKKLARAGQLQELASAIAAQVRQEPDVLQAGATTSLRRTGSGAFVIVQLRVVQIDARERSFLFEFPVDRRD